MTREAYIILYEKRADGRCTPEELEQLAAFEEFQLMQENGEWEAVMGNRDEIRDRLSRRIEKSLQEPRKRNIPWGIWTGVAAAIVLLIIGFLGYDLKSYIDKAQKPSPPHLALNNTKARLTLSDGSIKELDGNERGLLVKDDHLAVLSTADGQLIYQFNEGHDTMEAEEKWNNLETPKGGTYQLQLPDGSKVWLNAASSLRFSNQFNSRERVLELRGEAYFEVSKSNKPFRVLAGNTEVAVLGTHFNISAYGDEQFTKTSLLTGAVKVNYGDIHQLLKPGQQAVVQQGKPNISIQQLDMEEAIAWHKGLFLFSNEDIRLVMRKIQRWYDVDVVYSPDITNYQLSGSISRDGTLKDVLQMLELTGIVHFKLEGRRIYVMK
ncbi:DUF4974 domain-containing protein [Olivibacter ginsenosidimutans]|uniref:DUF4974 domain-containing protein n=1 Tax=Olivibacter ginsenosidimutans TaxID=1176537 RepID=A0ABP9BSI0_9SPHI